MTEKIISYFCLQLTGVYKCVHPLKTFPTPHGFANHLAGKVYDLVDLRTPIFVAASFSTLHPLLRTDTAATSTGRERTSAKENLVEILVTDLGDVVTRGPYLIVPFPYHLAVYSLRSSSDENPCV